MAAAAPPPVTREEEIVLRADPILTTTVRAVLVATVPATVRATTVDHVPSTATPAVPARVVGPSNRARIDPGPVNAPRVSPNVPTTANRAPTIDRASAGPIGRNTVPGTTGVEIVATAGRVTSVAETDRSTVPGTTGEAIGTTAVRVTSVAENVRNTAAETDRSTAHVPVGPITTAPVANAAQIVLSTGATDPTAAAASARQPHRAPNVPAIPLPIRPHPSPKPNSPARP